MTGRYEQVADQITRLSGGSFQRMMDAYARLHFPDLANVTSEGSHKTKRKTKIGTPDSIYWLDTGAVVMAEHSTRAEGIVPKFRKDLDKCAEKAQELGLDRNEFEVVLCYNDRFEANEEIALRKYGDELEITLKFIDLDTLAIDISLVYPEIAEEHLGIPYDTGQVMTVDNFIRFHHKHAGEWVTPINNPLIGRDDENGEVDKSLVEHKAVVLGGAPGVGKTKFAIEFLRLKKDREGVPVFVIRDNHQSVWADVQRLKRRSRKFILLIDDADRQLPLVEQVLTLIKGSTDRDNIQLLLTVRSIAKRDLEEVLQKISWREIRLAGPTELSIRAMVSGHPYCISDEQLVRRIVQVSHSNARFAMMAARLAQDDSTALRTGRIGDIYRAYYQRYIRNVEELDSPPYVRVLGLLAIFRVVRTDKEAEATFASLLSFVGLSKTKFLDCVAGLEKRELVEREYEVVKMDDQHLRAYYFYRAFMEDGLLDFGDLLSQFYNPNDNRFRNVVYSTSENFGKQEVRTTLGLALTSYSESLSGDDLVAFYENFGDLWPERSLDLAGSVVMRTPKVENPVFSRIEKNNVHRSYIEDRLLRLVAVSFHQGDTEFRQGLELSFEYVRRKPELIEDLVTQLGSISYNEYRSDAENAARQQSFFSYLLVRVEANDALSKRVFLEMIDGYLRSVSGVRSFLDYYREYNKRIETEKSLVYEPFRAQLWKALTRLYDEFPREVANIVKLTPNRRVKSYRQLLELDRKYLIDLFSTKFSSDRVEESLIVQEIAQWLNTKGVGSEELTKVKQEHYTSEIQLFDNLSWREGEFLTRVKGKDFNGYGKQKRRDLAKNYSFSSVEAFERFLNVLRNIYSLPEAESNQIKSSVDFILANIRAKDHNLGVACVRQYIEKIGPRAAVALNTTLEAVTQTYEQALSFMEMLDKLKLDQAIYWRAYAFHWINPSYLNENLRGSFHRFVSSFQKGEELRLETLRKFSRNTDELGQHLKLWHKAVAQDNVQPRYSDLGELTEKELSDHFYAVKQLYLVFGRDDIFDMKQKLLMRILHRDVSFFMDYVDRIVSQPALGQRTPRDEELGFIWAFPEATEMMPVCLESVLRDRYVSLATYSTSWLDSHFDPFFKKIGKGREQAEAFALDYIARNCKDVKKCRSMMDCIGKNLRSIGRKALFRFLDNTQEAEDFVRIDWGSLIRNYGDDDDEDFAADKNVWQALQRMLMDYPGDANLFEVKQLIRNRLNWAKRSEERRKRDVFIGNQW